MGRTRKKGGVGPPGRGRRKKKLPKEKGQKGSYEKGKTSVEESANTLY